MPARFSIWAAVSTKAQAKGYGSDIDELDDKDSLEVQIEKTRAAGKARGWVESSGPFVVPGESRTRWINLRDAENELPALKEMLNAAQRGEFDVLAMYDYTRLRELLDPVARTLAAYRVQLYSLSQPVEPVPPDEYDPANSDTANVMQFVSGFTSRAELAAFRRRRQIGMPRRIAKGLHAGSLPYGYRKPPGREMDRKVVPIIDPARAAVVVEIKDKFLDGASLPQLAESLNEQGVPAPRGKRWGPSQVRYLLKNRYYSGEVIYGRHIRRTDPRTGKVGRSPAPEARLVTARGVHDPLWDEATQRAIDDEFARRGKKYAGKRTHRLSGLLYCGVCGGRMWVHYGGWKNRHPTMSWWCYVSAGHARIHDDVLVPRVMERFAAALRDIENIHLPTPQDRRTLLEATIADLSARRSRLLEAYESGAMPLDLYSARMPELDTQLAARKKELADSEGLIARAGERRDALTDLARLIDAVPNFLMSAPAQETNSHLRAILERIIVHSSKKIELVFRT